MGKICSDCGIIILDDKYVYCAGFVLCNNCLPPIKCDNCKYKAYSDNEIKFHKKFNHNSSTH